MFIYGSILPGMFGDFRVALPLKGDSRKDYEASCVSMLNGLGSP